MTHLQAVSVQPEAHRAFHFLSQRPAPRGRIHGTPVPVDAGPTAHLVGLGEKMADRMCSLLRSRQIAARDHADILGVGSCRQSGTPSCLIIAGHALPNADTEAVGAMTGTGPVPPMVIVAESVDARIASWAIQTGVVDLIANSGNDDHVIDAVERALDVDRRRRHEADLLKQLSFRFATLTRREAEVMMLVAQGLLNKQVGGELNISEITVKAHRGSAMRKMEARTFADLIRMADILAPLQIAPSDVVPAQVRPAT